jgi:hypothetical protein
MTVAQLRVLRAAGRWAIEGEEFLDDWMRQQGCGRNWQRTLRKALAEISRELARQTFGKGRRK